MKPRILPAVTICSLVVSAPAVAFPLEGRLVGLVTESYGMEAEIALRVVPLTLGARTVSLDGRAPGGQLVYVRTTGVHPSATPAFGVSGTLGAVVVPTIGFGRAETYTGGFGLVYQQAWGPLWGRISPNVLIPPDFFSMIAVGHPWLELGCAAGQFELSLRSSAFPLALG